ncbi:DUF5641 domain-containing protein [Trichonephila clavipes]|nr:DUF5641 domain-containing protein [Trichonephila clavipes]
MQIESDQLWSDSTIALAWINTPPNQLKTVVSNRVSQIQQLFKDFQWKHISSEVNPADVLSRGLDVKELAANDDLWWKGPDWQNMAVAAPNSLRVSSTVTDQCFTNELKPMSKGTLKLNIDSNFIDNFLDRTNNFHKLIRILAFIFRFIKNCKTGVKHKPFHLFLKNMKSGRPRTKLTLEEFIIVIVQIERILNFRPLTPLSSDTDDFQVLTPDHFQIGKPINAIPEPNKTDKVDNLLNKWQKTQTFVQTIWKIWQNGYLSHLLQRTKWMLKQPNILPGMMVLRYPTTLKP